MSSENLQKELFVDENERSQHDNYEQPQKG